MRAFAEAWPDEQFVQQSCCTIPGDHQTRLLDRIKDRPTREWYMNATVENGWSRNVLAYQVLTRLHERQGKALTNFTRALSPEGSDLAEQILRSPSNSTS
jgi:predicted nuclease of restriction endonuclease-like (RecB) superfamily